MTAPWEKYAQGDGPWSRYTGPAAAPAERQPAPDIPGTPTGYADRVGLIPTDQYQPAPQAQAQRAAPVPQEERGLFSRIRAGVEAARSTIASIVPGGVGFGLGAAEGMLRNIASGKFGTQEGAGLVEQTAAKRAQQFTEATVDKPPSALGQEYAQDVGEFMQRHGASVLAGPLGVTGTGRHTENLRNARQGLKAAMATTEAPPGLPPVAGEVPGAVKPAGGLAKRMVQPNPALLEAVPAAEKAGLTVLPHHVAEGETVRALGTAAGGAVYKQNTKAFTKALIKELDPDETASRLDTKTFHRVLDKQGKTIGESMAKYDMPVDDALRARLEAISKDAADNADADTGRMTMNRVREIVGKAEAGGGQITGQAVRELDTAIGRQIRSNTKNQDLVARLRAVQDVLRDTAEGQMAPDEAKAVQQARRRYAYAMEILPDIDDFGRTGYYEPGQLWKRLTGSEAGRQRVANERGGLTDLAKAGALVADRSGTGHGYVSVGGNSVGVGAGGMRAYASPGRLLELGVGAVGGSKAYNRFGPNLVKRLAAEHDAELARAAQVPEPPPLELAAPDAPTPQGPRPDVRGEVPAEVPEWTTTAGVDAQKPGSQIPAIAPEGLLPAVGDDMPPARINPAPRPRVPDIPAVPGRPDMPDVMVAGGPSEVAGNLASGVTGAGKKGPIREAPGMGEAMLSPDAALARQMQGYAPKKPPEPPAGGGGGGGGTPAGGLDPRLAKIAELRRQAPSQAVKKVLDAREAEIKKIIKRETDITELEAAAQATDDVDLRQSLLAEANKLRGEKLPVGEVAEGQPGLPKPKTEKIPVGKVIDGQPDLPVGKTEKIPVGDATEITPEVVEAAPERLPVGEATEMPERLPVGEVAEDPIPVGEAAEFERLPVGEATEITPEVVDPARGPVVPEATNVDNAPTTPAGGGRSEGMEQTKGEFTQSLTREPASWVIREKATGKVVMETFDRKKVDALNTEKYEAVPALQHLQEINRNAKESTRTPQAPAGGGRSEGVEQTKITHAGMDLEETPGKGGEPAQDQAGQPAAGPGASRAAPEPGNPSPLGLTEEQRRAAIDAETMENRSDAPEVAHPTKGRRVKVYARTLNGVNAVTANLYELPGYKGPQLAVKEYKTSRGQGYRVYLPKSGAFIHDNNGVGTLADTLQLAVLRIQNARDSIAKRSTTPKAAAPAPQTPQAPAGGGAGMEQTKGGYAAAKEAWEKVKARSAAAADAIKKYPKGPNGMTPDAVKKTEAWRRDYAEYEQAFANERKWNASMLRKYGAEIRAERQAAREAKVQPAPAPQAPAGGGAGMEPAKDVFASYTDANRKARERTETTGVPHEAKSRDAVDGDGYTVREWFVAPKTDAPKGMSLDDAKAHIERANQERPFGLSWDALEAKQGGKLTRAPQAPAGGGPVKGVPTPGDATRVTVPPLVRAMVGAATASAAALRDRVSQVRWAPTDVANNGITFLFDGKPMVAELRGRNADAVLRGKDAESDRALAVRTMLDGDMKTEPTKRAPAADVQGHIEAARAALEDLKAMDDPAAGPGGSRAVPVSALNDGVADLGRVIQPGYYSEGYPWQTGYEAQVSGSSIAQDGRDILAAGEKYTVPGMRLRDAIRHAEIVGDPVPQEAYARLESLKRKPTPKPAPQAPAGGAQPKVTPEPVKPAAVEPDPLALTPKQYHEAKLRSMADENGASMPEVREMYDTEAGRANNTQEWVQAVMDAAKAGKPITRATLDKLEEVRPRAVGQIMHDYPYAKLPEGYQVPGARKAETEEAAARRANRAAAKAGARAPQTTPEPVEPAAPKPTSKTLTPAEVKAELVRQLDDAHAKAGGEQFTPDDVSGPHRENGNQVLHMQHQPDAESSYNIYLRAVRDDKQGYWTVYGKYGTTGKEVRLDQTAELSPAGAKGYLARLMPNVAEKDGVPKISPRDSFVTVRAGGSEHKIRNTRERIAEFKKELLAAKPTKPSTEKATDALSKRAPLKTITDMIDDFDSQAAVDFAAAQGIDLEVALKGDRRRLDRVRGLKPTPDTP